MKNKAVFYKISPVYITFFIKFLYMCFVYGLSVWEKSMLRQILHGRKLSKKEITLAKYKLSTCSLLQKIFYPLKECNINSYICAKVSNLYSICNQEQPNHTFSLANYSGIKAIIES